MTPAEEIAARKVENAALHERVAALAAQVQELGARLAKDSHNSGKPPGGQLGHRGETLRLVATPDAVVEHRPAVCPGCQAPLGADAPVVLRECHQD